MDFAHFPERGLVFVLSIYRSSSYNQKLALLYLLGTSLGFPPLLCGSRLGRVTHRNVIDVTRQQALCFLLCSQEALVRTGPDKSPPTSLCSYFKGIIENPR